MAAASGGLGFRRTRILELINKTGPALTAKLDVSDLVHT